MMETGVAKGTMSSHNGMKRDGRQPTTWVQTAGTPGGLSQTDVSVCRQFAIHAQAPPCFPNQFLSVEFLQAYASLPR